MAHAPGPLHPDGPRPAWIVVPTHYLVHAIAVLTAIAAATGLLWSGGATFDHVTHRGEAVTVYGHGLYRYDSVVVGAGNRGVDGTLLAVAIPVLLLAERARRRGSSRGALTLVATLAAILYVYATLALGASFNELLLVYTTLAAASALALAQLLPDLDTSAVRDRHGPGSARVVGVFLIAVAVLTSLVWLLLVVEPYLAGSPPALGGATTYFTPAIDFAVVLPAAALAGILILRREPAGYALALLVLGILAFLGPALVGQLVAQSLAGVVFTTQELIVFVATFVIMSGGGLLALGSLLHAVPARPRPDLGSQVPT